MPIMTAYILLLPFLNQRLWRCSSSLILGGPAQSTLDALVVTLHVESEVFTEWLHTITSLHSRHWLYVKLVYSRKTGFPEVSHWLVSILLSDAETEIKVPHGWQIVVHVHHFAVDEQLNVVCWSFKSTPWPWILGGCLTHPSLSLNLIWGN